MRIFNDAIENSVGVNSSNGGEFIGVGYSPYVPPANGLIVRGNVGIATTSALQALVVQGNALVSGFVTSAGFFGPATNITNLNASNLVTGIVSSSVISGAYSGITSVGTLSQLNVSGFSTVYSLWLDAQVYDINNSPGSSGSLLTSIGSGVAWSTPSQVGIITGSASANQIAYWNASNQITGSGNFVINGLGSVGIGTSIPTSAITVQGDALINGATVGLGGGGNNSSNTTVGVQALSINTTLTINNVSIGYQANQNATSANSNVMVGYQAGKYFNGGQSISMGYQALSGSSTTSITQTAIVAVGYQAAQFANASNIVVIGYKALQGTAVTTTNLLTDNTVVGYAAGQYLSSSSNTVVGHQALQGSATTPLSAVSNVAIGKYAARFTSAPFNISIGREAMQGADGQSTGAYNIAIGGQALTNITGASFNVAIGYQAAQSSTSGSYNTIVGHQARLGSATTPLTSSNIVAIGGQAAKYHSGSNSVFVGYNAGAATSTVFGTGAGNVVVGYQAMQNPTSANNNVIIGQSAGSNIITGSNNIIIGSGANSSNGAYQIGIGVNVAPLGSNAGAWGQNVSANRTDLGVGTYGPIARVHIETLAAPNAGLYIAGAASQTANLLQIDATSSGTNYVTVGSAGSVGIGTATPTQSLHIQNSMRVSGRLFDNNNSSGTTGQVLAVTASGIAWTNAASGGGGTITGSVALNQVAFGIATNSIQGSNNLWFNGSSLGVGTSSVTQALTVQGNATVSGITTSGTFSGSGLLITSLNASNLTSGTVSSSVISGDYSGITSVGTLSQLNVSGFVTSAGFFAPSISSISNIDFNINTLGLTTAPGRMFWDATQQELAISLLYNGEIAHLGQDQVQQIYNNTGATLGVGTVVYYNGVYSGWPTVSLADSTIFNRGVGVGVIQNAIASSSYGYIHISGPVLMNTTGYSTGPLYLSTIPGILTSVQPSSPNFSVNIAYAINSETNGQIIVWPGSPLRVNQTGSILFADAQGKPGSSFTSFFIDVTGGTYNVGIGTNVAPNRLSVQGSANFDGSVSITTSLTLNAAQGTPPLIINSTTQVNNLNPQYWAGNTYPLTQIGDMFYASGVGGSTLARIPPNATSGLQFLGQAGDGVTAGAPSWQKLPTTGFLNYFMNGTAATNVPGVYQLSSVSPTGLGTITTVFNSAGTIGLGSFINDPGVPNLSYLPAGNLIAYAWLYQTADQAGRFASVTATFYEANGFGTVIGVIGTTNSATISASPIEYTLTYSQNTVYNLQSTASRIKVALNATTTGNTNTILFLFGTGQNSYVNISAPGADVTNFVPYTGAVKDINIGNFGITLNNLDLNYSPIGINTIPGRITWNVSAGKPQVGLSYNNETANLAGNVTLVYNSSGSVVGVGSVVYINGTAGVNTAVPTIGFADNLNYSHALGVGVVSKQIGIGSYGYIHIAGTTNANTSAFNAGDILYVSSSAGILTNVSPYAPNFNVVVGVALNSTTNGSILVQPSSPNRFNNQGALLFANSQGLPYGITTAFFVNDSSGTYGLGIGTTSPGARLEINVTNFPNNKAILLRGAVGQSANIFEVRDSNNVVYNSITGIGSVGIGTFSPTRALHVQGSTRLTGGIYDSNNLPGTPIGIVSQFLASTGTGVTWAPVKRSLVTQLMTAFTPSATGVDSAMFIVPQDPNDGLSTMNFTFKRVNVRVETASAGISTINIVKYIGTGNASGLQTAILSSNILLSGASTYEGFSTSFASGFSTCASSDKLAVNFIGYSTAHSNFTVELIMRET
jgi:hypothetical protein